MNALNVVTLEQAKLWLKIDPDDDADDSIVTSLIKAAVSQVEKYTLQILYQRAITARTGKDGIYRIYEYPLISIESLINCDNAEVAYTDVETDWYTDVTSDDTARQTVTFVAGYGWDYEGGSEVPEDIITALKELIAYLYENRDNPKAEWPVTVTYLLGPYRRVTLF